VIHKWASDSTVDKHGPVSTIKRERNFVLKHIHNMHMQWQKMSPQSIIVNRNTQNKNSVFQQQKYAPQHYIIEWNIPFWSIPYIFKLYTFIMVSQVAQ
jgi:hypothetical protein